MNQLVPQTAKNEGEEKILLVDDNSSNLQILLQTLSGRGYKLLIAKNGDNAMNIVHTVRPVLMLLDIMMPGIDGYDVCKQLKEDPTTADIIVIFLSALNDTCDKVRGLEIGAVDYIVKPFQVEDIIARVETHLKIHRLEQALARRNRQLEAENQHILESIGEGVFGINGQGKITFANPAASRITGWEPAELTGANAHKLLMPRCVDGTIRPWEQTALYTTLTENVVQTVEDDLFWRRDGNSFPVDYSCTPCMCDGESEGAVIVFLDVTEKRRHQNALQSALNELQEQKDKLMHMSRLSCMGEMASGFAHEVNQPLTAIYNYAQVCHRLVQREPIDKASLREGVDKIGVQARRAGDIIARIRSFVKKPDHCLQVVDCSRLVQDVVKLAEVDARHNCMEIHLDLAEDLPAIKVDTVQTQQVVLNLIRNGMEAMQDMPDKNVGLWVRTERLDREFVRVSVIDRGYGLADDAEEKLFTPFYTTKDDGMGIGLSICYSIIQTHGGVLNFIRNPEGGTTFWFTVPVAELSRDLSTASTHLNRRERLSYFSD
ncbi:MAG: response regulator [Endozoicomonadaceae bacterium]|nr:response regulator [Endozoicomonadaceae bacterium]